MGTRRVSVSSQALCVALCLTSAASGDPPRFKWDWYINGALEHRLRRSTSVALPTAKTWFICGRQGAHSLGARVDEIRMSDFALTPDQFLISGCNPISEDEMFCDDGIDDDCDGDIDREDVDCNGDGAATGTDPNTADVIFALRFAFVGGAAPPYAAACDVDGDGRIIGSVTDSVFLLKALFRSGELPAAPFPDCGMSRERGDVELGCADARGCAE